MTCGSDAVIRMHSNTLNIIAERKEGNGGMRFEFFLCWNYK